MPGTKLHQATTYAINQRAYFERCFACGRFEIDNGEAERQIRPLKLGEKNFATAWQVIQDFAPYRQRTDSHRERRGED